MMGKGVARSPEFLYNFPKRRCLLSTKYNVKLFAKNDKFFEYQGFILVLNIGDNLI